MSTRRNWFGTTDTGQVFFNILVDSRDGGQVPDWTLRIVYEDHVYPYADPPRSDPEYITSEPSTVTWRVWLASREDYAALRAKLGQTDTLYVLHNLQSQGDTVQVIDTLYEALAGTTLLALDRPAFAVDEDNGCEVDVTFRRHIDPATGEAVVS